MSPIRGLHVISAGCGMYTRWLSCALPLVFEDSYNMQHRNILVSWAPTRKHNHCMSVYESYRLESMRKGIDIVPKQSPLGIYQNANININMCGIGYFPLK